MSSRSSSAIASPICSTSLSRESFPERLWSIFRCAIERTSSRRMRSSAGRSRALSSNGTTSPFPRAFAVIIAASAQATSSRGLAAFSGPMAIPVETESLPTASASSSPELDADALGERGGAPDVAGREDHRELLAADAADDVRRADGRAEHVGDRCRRWSPMPWP